MSSWKERHNSLPLIFLVVGLLVVLWMGLEEHSNDEERIVLETRITAEQLKLRIESCFNSRAGLVQTLAGYPWQTVGQLRSEWSDRAEALLPLQSGVQALNYVDPNGVIAVVHPLEPNRPALNANLRQNPNPSVVDALARAEATGTISRTRIVDLLQGGKGFALYQPVEPIDGQAAGFVNGVFRIDDLMASCLPEGRLRQNFAFALYEKSDVFYRSTESDADNPRKVEQAVAAVDTTWRLTVAPREAYLKATAHHPSYTWVGLGILLCSLLAGVFRFALLKQRDIREREEEYRLLVENQADYIVKVDIDGLPQYVSPSYCDMLGKPSEEIIGQPFLPYVHEDDRESTLAHLESLKEPPYTTYYEQRAMSKDGWRWLAWSCRAIRNDNDETTGLIAVGRDVTEVKRLEERIAHSQKMRAMGELAGGITHDFNNLLQVILGNVEFLLLNDQFDGNARKSLEGVRDISLRAMSLTKKLQTLSRQDTPHMRVFEVSDLLVELRQLLQHTLPASIELSVDKVLPSITVLGDPSQLEQVLLNLCFNARDAIGAKGRIKVRTSCLTVEDAGRGPDPRLDAGDYVVIAVEDDGQGMDPEILPRIFDPFFTTKSGALGTGLGLANSYSIVEQHSGIITVDSTPDAGSCFSVYLPLASRSASVESSEDDADSASTQGSLERGLALVADDNPDLADIACKVLETAGFRTCKAFNGRQALELYEERRDDITLLLLDLVMPEMSGQEVALEVRKSSKDVPILFVSGFVPEETKAALNEPLIRKPYTIDQLMSALDAAGLSEPQE